MAYLAVILRKSSYSFQFFTLDELSEQLQLGKDQPRLLQLPVVLGQLPRRRRNMQSRHLLKVQLIQEGVRATKIYLGSSILSALK